jgi:hypothetical protein
MKYLLDTHIWLWSLLEPDKLDANVVKVLENKDNFGQPFCQIGAVYRFVAAGSALAARGT